MGVSSKIVRIHMESFDPGVVDQSMKHIASVVKSLKIPISGPVPLPTKKEIFTVKKSPHVYKKANEQFQLCIHRRLLDIYTDSYKITDSLSKIVLPNCVNITIKFI